MPNNTKPPARRRNSEKDAETRELLIDTAVEILRTAGCNAVSARKVAARAGLSHQIVHYYFQSMEELLLEVIHRASIKHLDALRAARTAPQPLWEAWLLLNKKDSGRLEMEYLAIANQYPRAQQILTALRGEYRKEVVSLLSNELDKHQLKSGAITPSIAVTAIHAIARTMALEAAHGTLDGHDEIKALIEQHLEELEGPCRSRGRHPN